MRGRKGEFFSKCVYIIIVKNDIGVVPLPLSVRKFFYWLTRTISCQRVELVRFIDESGDTSPFARIMRSMGPVLFAVLLIFGAVLVWAKFTGVRQAAQFTNTTWDNTHAQLTFGVVATPTQGMTLTMMIPLAYSGLIRSIQFFGGFFISSVW